MIVKTDDISIDVNDAGPLRWTGAITAADYDIERTGADRFINQRYQAGFTGVVGNPPERRMKAVAPRRDRITDR